MVRLLALEVVAALVFLNPQRNVCAFQVVSSPLTSHRWSRTTIEAGSERVHLQSSLEARTGSANDDDGHFGRNFAINGSGGDESSEGTKNLLSEPSAASRLSHAMLQVPSVDETVYYWKKTANAKVTASSKSENDNEELRSAFVTLGNGKTVDDCFALELVKNKNKSFELGNAISYLGISKLIQYANTEDLLQVLTGNAKKPPTESEPNGMTVTSCASAPGDFFARFCLHATDMQATRDFYTDILGMKLAAVDEDGKMLCLRYESPMRSSSSTSSAQRNEKGSLSSSYGVSTTLVFEPLLASTSLDKGNCFDHLVIATQADVDAVYEQLQTDLEDSDLKKSCHFFMKPTEMFGKKVVGIIDPNGYKIILAGNT